MDKQRSGKQEQQQQQQQLVRLPAAGCCCLTSVGGELTHGEGRADATAKKKTVCLSKLIHSQAEREICGLSQIS